MPTPPLPNSPSLLCALHPKEREDFFPAELWARLEALPYAVHYWSLSPESASREALAEKLEETRAEVLVSAWATPPLPENLPVGAEGSLRYVCHLTGSVRNLIPRILLERGLRATNWGGTVSRTVAECTLLLTLSALRRSSYWAIAMHREQAWKDKYSVVTESLFERRVGIHGFGMIAREFVRLLQPFGLRVETFSPHVKDDLLAEYGVARSTHLADLFAQNDIVIELAPATPENFHLIDEAMLRRIRPGGLFVNVGRGCVVDEVALAKVAAEGSLQVALDVFETEPLPADSPLRGLPNVTLLPHLGGPTKDRRRDSGALACANLERYLSGTSLEAEITPEIYDRST